MKSAHKEMMKARRRNICLVVSYDGTNYHGFQRQTPPVIAVQNVLERTLEKIFGDEIELAAAGRTDAGVHAIGQVVNFFTDGSIPIERVARAANGLLPPDIVINNASEASRDFSALHSASRKTYRYRIYNCSVMSPFERNYAWHIAKPLDCGAMREAMGHLVGEHDFSSFRAAGGADISPVREMDIASISREGKIITMIFRADGFLYHMVRNIVGTLKDVGSGRLMPDDFRSIMDARNRGKASPTAPAHGLCLMRVDYEN